jgi:hypothetical protein
MGSYRVDTVTTHPALAYAENELGVHSVWNDAQEASLAMDEVLVDLDKAQDRRKELDQLIENREMDLLISERGKHPDHSEAAFNRHLKEVHYKDAELQNLKVLRNSAAGEASGLELDVQYAKARISILAARMTELGGYLHYLGAVKEAESMMQVRVVNTAEKTEKPQETV